MGLSLLIFLPWLPSLWRNLAFVYRDSFFLFYPLRAYAAAQIRQGQMPLWCPLIFGGTPFFANVQAALFYPPQILTYILPFNLGLNLQIVFHFIGAALGMYSLAQISGVDRKGCWLSGLVFGFGTPLLSTVEYLPLFNAFSWLPWCLWSALRLYRAPTFSHAACTALIWACMLLAGSPDMAAMTVLCTIFFLGAEGLDRGKFKRRAGIFVATLVLVCSLVAFQYIPFWREITLSNRETSGFVEQLTFWSLHPLELLTLAVPTLYGGIANKWFGQLWLYGLSIGIVPLLLALGIPIKNRRVRWLTAAFVVFTLLAMARYVPALGKLLSIAPVLSKIRFPSKYYLVSLFLLTLLAGFGLSHWETSSRRRKSFVASAYLLLAAAGVAQVFYQHEWLQILLRHFPRVTFEAPQKVWQLQKTPLLTAQTAVFGLALGFFIIARRKVWAPILPLVLTALSVLELLLYAPFFTEQAPDVFMQAPAKNLALLHRENGYTRVLNFDLHQSSNTWAQNKTDYRDRLIDAKESLALLLPILHGVSFASCYQGLIPKTYAEATAAFRREILAKENTQEPLTMLEEWGITHVVASGTIHHPMLKPLTREPVWIYETIPQPLYAFIADGNERHSWTVSRPSPNEIHVNLATAPLSHTSNFILHERFHPGWHAWVDGKARNISPASPKQLGMLVALAPGDRRLEFKFCETGWPWLGLLAILSLLACFWLITHAICPSTDANTPAH